MTGFRSPLPTVPASGGRTDGWRADSGRTDGRVSAGARVPGGRRRSVPHLVLGALLVVACAVGFAVTVSGIDHRASVLALARPVAVGQRLTSTDVHAVRISAGSGVATIPASQLHAVLGLPMAVSLPAGALLTRNELGPVDVPAGQAVVAVAVKSGQAPPDLASGEHVLLVPTASGASGEDIGAPSNSASPSSSTPSGAAGSTSGPWSGVVTGVVPATAVEDTTVVSVQLPTAAARLVAGLPAGDIDLVLVPGS